MITKSEELTEACKQTCEYVAFDTEFSRKKGHYYPIPSLIQFSFDDKKAFIVDLYSKEIDGASLIEILLNDQVIKVFHSVKQDLEVLFRIFNTKPKKIFDVQVASMFLGNYETPSYDVLVMDFLNERLDKSLQFSDWVTRPLSQDQLNYAARDVTFLYKLFPEIKKSLGDKKYSWAVEEMENILNFDFENHLNTILEKLLMGYCNKNGRAITPQQVAVFERIVRWRENFSLKENRLRERILENSRIQDLANKIIDQDFDIKHLKRFKLRKTLFNSLRSEIDSLESYDLEKANRIFDKCLKKREIIISKSVALKSLRSLLKTCSHNSMITQSLIATKDDLLNILVEKELTPKFSKGWRYEVLGRYI